MKLTDLYTRITYLKEQALYEPGTKIYRVLEDGAILMDKVWAIEVRFSGEKDVELHHLNTDGRRMPIPEDGKHVGWGWGSRIHSWHLDRREANKAAAPLQKADRAKDIERKKQQIKDLTDEVKDLEAKNAKV